MKQVYLDTYGCQMNVADTNRMELLLFHSGYLRTGEVEDADLVLVNTCSIREKAEQKIYSLAGSLKPLKEANPDLILGVTGCLAQQEGEQMLRKMPFLDLILGPDGVENIVQAVDEVRNTNHPVVWTHFDSAKNYHISELSSDPPLHPGASAFVNIIKGCDKFCTFCVVPFTRGREKSREAEEIEQEVRLLVSRGAKEIILLGQNVNSYRTERGYFPQLLESIAKIPGVKRIRYTSPHPQDMDDHLLQVMTEHENICNYVHLPLQAGSDRILHRMNRTYTKAEFLTLVDSIRKFMPNCSISTDIIVGFPGETTSEYEETLEVMNKVVFDRAFMFKYSSRPGTKAAEYTDQIDENIKQERLAQLIDLQQSHTLIANQHHIGKVLKVMVEKESKKSPQEWSGRTEGNMGVIFDKNDEQIKDIVNVLIQDAQGVSMFGNRVLEKEMIHEVN